MPLEEPINRLKSLERRINELERKGFQLKYPLDVFTRKIIKDVIDAEVTEFAGYTSKARAYRATSVQSINNESPTKIQLNAESYDVDGEFDSSSDYRFTATTTGYYQVNGVVKYSATVDGKVYVTIIRRNNTDIATSQLMSAGTDLMGVVIADVIYLTAEQYLELFTYHNSGAAKTIEYGTSKTYMSVHRIS